MADQQQAPSIEALWQIVLRQEAEIERLKRCGKSTITLDPKFAASIKPGRYHVFLTPEGSSRGLYVASKDNDGFEVREQDGGASHVGFSYRVAGLRADVKVPRLKVVRAEEPRFHGQRTLDKATESR